MAVAYRSGSNGGTLVERTSVPFTVPAGAAANDVVVVYLSTWQGAVTVTPPSGFTQKGAVWSSSDGQAQNSIWWKRLTGADSGSYTFTLNATKYSSGAALCFTGCVTTGDPFDAVATPTSGSWGTIPSISVTTTDPAGGLVWFFYNDTSAAKTPPTGFTETADYDCGAAAYRIPGSSGSQTATGATVGSTSPAGQWLGGLLSAPTTPRESVDLTHVGSSAWVAPASSAAVAPTYPSGLAAGDAVYAFLHIKPDTATVATPTNWSLVGAAAGGSGTQGAGTGATRMHVYKRAATAGLSGTESFTITGGSAPMGFMRAYRAAGTNVAFEETVTSWSVATASTTIGGTAGASLDLAAKDEITAVIGTTDDQSTTLTLTGLSATGATLGTLTNDPTGTTVNAQGNDISSAAYRIPVTAGTSTSAPVATATSSSSETAMGLLLRVRATADVATALPGPIRLTTVGAIVRSHYW